jgi:hypothetical protein
MIKFLPALALGIVVFVGCSSTDDGTDAVARANSTNILRLSNLYNAYQVRHDLNGPADEAALKQFVETLDPELLKRIDIEPGQTEAVFISERDSQPFKLRYKVKGNIMGSSEPVVFEATGVDGKREVGFLNMTSREVDSSEYDELWAGKFTLAEPARTR